VITRRVGNKLQPENSTARRMQMMDAVLRCLGHLRGGITATRHVRLTSSASETLDIQAALRTCGEPERLLINRQFVILPSGP
jgi:hypothetical protein